MRVVKGLARPADAYQFLKETEDQLAGLLLQTGPVTVQKEDELNRIPGRCYVPTIWGAAVLEYGDWFVVYDVGIVTAHTDAQFRLLFEFDDSATLFELSKEPELEVVTKNGLGMETSYVTVPQHEAKALRMDVGALSLEGVDRHLDALVEEKIGAPLPMPEMAPALRFRAMNDGASWLPAFQAFCDRYRLDYVIEATEDFRIGRDDFRVKVNATGADVVAFSLGDLVDCYPDGRLVLVEEGSDA